MTPDAHMVETLRLRTEALHRVIASNGKLRRTLARVEALAESAGDLDNGILVWDLRKALDGTP